MSEVTHEQTTANLEIIAGWLHTALKANQKLYRKLDVAEAEAAHWRRVVEWYASPEQWRVHCDDRGRDTFTFRYGEDGGWVAAQALKKWRQNNG